MRRSLLALLVCLTAVGYAVSNPHPSHAAQAQSPRVQAGALVRIYVSSVGVPLYIAPGQTVQMYAIGFDALGNEVPIHPHWSASPSKGCGKVASTGVVTGSLSRITTDGGMLIVYAQDGNISGAAGLTCVQTF